jgi:tellurite resistance protein
MKHKLLEDAKVSQSAIELRVAVDKAIQDGFLTRDEYDKIINIVATDGNIDKQEEVILKEFHQMIYDKEIKIKKS